MESEAEPRRPENKTAVERSGKHRRRSESREPNLLRHLDLATELLIYGILIFTPWAFGATENWAIKSVNTWNYLLGVLLASKWIVRWTTGSESARWETPLPNKIAHRAVVFGLATLTLLMLAYCGLSAWNARATFDYQQQSFVYANDSIKWLPASYEQAASWEAFGRYLAAACFFWALLDWLRTKTPRDLRAHEDGSKPTLGEEARSSFKSAPSTAPPLPERLSRLLWVLALNGAVLALEGTLQRLSGTDKLLWLVTPNLNNAASAQFGPFNYRSNGAQYLNLIWPVTLAFWWATHRLRRSKLGQGAEFVLLPLSGLMIAAPIIASSRGGIAVAIGQVLGVMAIFAYAFRKVAWWKTALPATLLIFIVVASVALQWDTIRGRFNENNMNTLSGRTEIYRDAKKIADDFPVWGTGPGTFGLVYYFYRTDPSQRAFAYAHDDFLQTLVTFGRFGITALGCMLVLVFGYWFLARGIPTTPSFVAFFWIALGGFLAHGKFDFPFQIYSLLLLFLTNCAMLMSLSRR